MKMKKNADIFIMDSVDTIKKNILTGDVKNALYFDDIDSFLNETQKLSISRPEYLLACLRLAREYGARNIHQELIAHISDEVLEDIRKISDQECPNNENNVPIVDYSSE